MPFADYMSLISGVRADPQGRRWIQRHGREGADVRPIDPIAPAGRYSGTLPPQALPNAVSSSGRVGHVERDALVLSA